MEKQVKITLIIAVAVVLVVLIVTSLANQSVSETISVTGESQVKVIPDLIGVYIGIEEKAQTAKEASDAAEETYNSLVSSLESKGISETEIKTTSLQVTPNYEWKNNQYTANGYVARHDIKVELDSEKDSSKISDVIDSSVNSGALINYINFELSDSLQATSKAEATEKATVDAKTKAEAIAQGLNARLGQIVSVSDSTSGYSPWPLYARAEDSATTSQASAAEAEASIASQGINPSEQIIYGNVQVVYKIK